LSQCQPGMRSGGKAAGMSSIRIKDVAKLADVSTATVSHVINKTRFVSDETKRRVLGAIEKVGYTPNVHARNLASGKSRTLGLIISDITNPFFPDLVKSVQERALELGYDVIVLNTNYDSERDARYVQRLLELQVQGVMILTTEMDLSVIERLSSRKIPVVFLDIGKVGPHISNIRVNYENGVHQAVEHLLALGHRQVAFISGPMHFKSAEIRRRAFLKTMKKHHASIHTEPVIYEGDFKMESGEQAVKVFLALKHRPTAIVAANDLMAVGALRELGRAGLQVPKDMSVVGCDDIWLAKVTDPQLTTIMIPRAKIGTAAVEAVSEGNSARGQVGREIRIQTELLVRESSGSVPR
jgi:DNA-binding LacI/PurR family transcriptional regulator